MTASHSSSFIRSSRLSRVMPALLTRIVDGAEARSRCPRAPRRPRRRRRRRAGCPVPRLPAAARYAAIFAAPSSVVAVPITVAPARASASAIARPMPRVAPVTSATCPSSVAFVHAVPPVASVRQPASAARAASMSAPSVSAKDLSSRTIRLLRPASTLPGPHSTTCVTPRAANAWMVSTQRTGLAACCASAARIASASGCSGDVDVVQHRNRRRRERHAGEPRREPLGRGLQQRAVERRRHRQQHAALGAPRRRDARSRARRPPCARRSRSAPAR